MTREEEMPADYPRDMVGYGRNPPHADWPGGARIALQIVLNYEEGGENNVLHGDAGSESFLSEIIGAPSLPGERHLNIESIYEYGSRAGLWRILRLFAVRGLPLTIFAVGMALERNPEAAAAMIEGGHEIACHGWRWIDYHGIEEATERAQMTRAIDTITRLTGQRPLGWYTGRISPQTRRLVVAEGGFLYDADSYADDLPYWVVEGGRDHLVVPYTLDANDMRFATAQGFNSGEQFYAYLRDTFDVLYEEGARSGRVMAIALHPYLIGYPYRIRTLDSALGYIESHDKVWFATGHEIADAFRRSTA